MKAIRIGNDIRIEWPLRLSGDVAKLTDLDLRVEVRPSEAVVDWHNYEEQPTLRMHTHVVMGNGGLSRFHDECVAPPRPYDRAGAGCLPPERRQIPDGHPPFMGDRRPHPHAPTQLPYHIEGNTLVAMWTADKQFETGEYDIIVYARKNSGGQAVADQCRFVRLVPHTAMADLPDDSGIEAVIEMQPMTIELSGLSAYEIAVINGFAGTQQEWLDSLKGGDSQAAADAAEKANEAAEKASAAAEAAGKIATDIEDIISSMVDKKIKEIIPDGKAVVLVDIGGLDTSVE